MNRVERRMFIVCILESVKVYLVSDKNTELSNFMRLFIREKVIFNF